MYLALYFERFIFSLLGERDLKSAPKKIEKTKMKKF
jgi:hypothetical protein